ncbi:unnamed protein product [Sympodiomycopsis kandeliae]
MGGKERLRAEKCESRALHSTRPVRNFDRDFRCCRHFPFYHPEELTSTMTPTAIDSSSTAGSFEASRSNFTTSKGELRGNAALDLVLDYNDWAGQEASADSRRKFVKTLRRSMVGLGFFYLRDSPLETLRTELFDATREFFELSEEEKSKIEQVNSRHFRGYSRIGSEYTQSKPDNRAQIDLGIEAPEFPPEVREPSFLNLWGPNQFPETPHRLRSLVLSYADLAEELTIQLTAALEEALGVPSGRLQNLLAFEEKATAFDKVRELAQRAKQSPSLSQQEIEQLLPAHLPFYRMKLVQYGKEGNEQGVGAHRDGGWITLLATDDQPGLQVEDLDGRWLDVPFRSSCILVNFGQQLERVSNGLINAATHRVNIKPSPKNRISTPYFSVPNMRAVIEPIPETEMSAEVMSEWRQAQERRKGRTSAVPEGDLHGNAQQCCGEMAWSGLTRSHPATFQRWYTGD